MEHTGFTCTDPKGCIVAFSRERDAVRQNSGESVDHSDPGLMEPSIPDTADRKSAARVERQGANLRLLVISLKMGGSLRAEPSSAPQALCS